jgi:hypothetical protein
LSVAGGEPLSDIFARAPDEALRGFLRHWHEVTAAPEDVRVAADVPLALRRLHQMAAAVPGFFADNHLLSCAQRRTDGDKELFYAENQWVAVWAINRDQLDAEDPPVWCREYDPGAPWRQDAPSVSVFLLQLAVFGAAMTGPHGAAAGWLSKEDTDRVLATVQELALPSWHWPAYPSRFYAGDDAVAFTCPNASPSEEGEPHLSVWIGALDEAAIRFVEPHLSDAWEHFSLWVP